MFWSSRRIGFGLPTLVLHATSAVLHYDKARTGRHTISISLLIVLSTRIQRRKMATRNNAHNGPRLSLQIFVPAKVHTPIPLTITTKPSPTRQRRGVWTCPRKSTSSPLSECNPSRRSTVLHVQPASWLPHALHQGRVDMPRFAPTYA